MLTLKSLGVISLLNALIVIFAPGTGSSNAAFSIDIGSMFTKIALVKPRVPMEIVLNKESKRKTPLQIAIRNGERFFSEAAVNMGIRHPANTFSFFVDLLGKQFNDPAVEAYRKQFPHLSILSDSRRGTVKFVTDSGEIPVETLFAMILWNSMEQVNNYAGGGIRVRDVVIAAPSFFGPNEKNALRNAAEIADLNLLELISSGSSAALNYGVSRIKEINENPQNVMIYDVGALFTQVMLVQYRLINEESTKDPIPVVETIGYGYDRSLGSHEITTRLSDLFVNEFKKNHKTSNNIMETPSALAKMLKEAERVKQVLSANIEHFAQIENVMEDKNFKLRITRDDLEALVKDLEPRFLKPIDDALSKAAISKDGVHQIVLMGAGTRMPRIQQILSEYMDGKEIGRFLNTDEATALGAVYRAACLSKGFRVKRFDVVEFNSSRANSTTNTTVVDDPVPPSSFSNWFSSSPADILPDGKQNSTLSEQQAASPSIENSEDPNILISSLNESNHSSPEFTISSDVAEEVEISKLTDEEISEAKSILAQYEKKEREKADRDQALNNLEASIYDYQSRLDDDDTFKRFGTVDELAKLRDLVEKFKYWLDEEFSESVNLEELKSKKRELEEPARKIRYRRKQQQERPKHVEYLEKAIKEAENAQSMFANLTSTFTDVELITLEKLVSNVREWYNGKKTEQASLADNQDPAFTVTDLKDKAGAIDREIKYLFNKYTAKMKEEAELAAKRAKEAAEKIAADAASKNKTESSEGKAGIEDVVAESSDDISVDGLQFSSNLSPDTTNGNDVDSTAKASVDDGRGDEEEADNRADDQTNTDNPAVEGDFVTTSSQQSSSPNLHETDEHGSPRKHFSKNESLNVVEKSEL